MATIRPMLRAEGNLTYLEFIRLVEYMWNESHPDIPILPAGNGDPARYPCIVYGVEMRKTHPNEPKARYRETRDDEDSDKAVVIAAQRFQNIVSFTAVTEQDPHDAEEIIEMFEDWMIMYIPVFKEQGISELLYARRLSDSEQNRSGQGVVRRTVTFLVTIEKVLRTDYDKLQQICVDARIFLENGHIQHEEWAPRSYGTPSFTVSDEDFTLLIAPATNFRIGDTVYIAPPFEGQLPTGLTNGYYMISNVVGTPYADTISYTIVKINREDEESYDEVTITSEGSGRIVYVEDVEVRAHIVDQFSQPTAL